MIPDHQQAVIGISLGIMAVMSVAQLKYRVRGGWWAILSLLLIVVVGPLAYDLDPATALVMAIAAIVIGAVAISASGRSGRKHERH